MIGVLDLQGGVFEHLDHLARIGVPSRSVKEPSDVKGLSGLIMPGGESTCLARLMSIFGVADAVVREHESGMKLWGTCAGAILLAKVIVGESPHLGLIDIDIERNSFGSQLESFSGIATIPRIASSPLPLTFIRAPKIRRVGPGVDILLQMDDYIAAAESPEVLVTVFHPELTASLAFHLYFVRKCGLEVPETVPSLDPAWQPTSWTRYRRTA
jgi:5'-phosphate synthase pdxT subunit